MHDRDTLHRFMFERFPIRGHLIHLDAAWHALLEHRDYPEPVRAALGEAAAAALLMAATIKFEGSLSLQLQGSGPVHLLLVQCSGGLGVRALARFREGAEAKAEELDANIQSLLGTGNVTVTLESDDAAQRYQGIVPISGIRLADSLQKYFEQSEQLPTRLWLHADEHGVAGLLLQRVPVAAPAASVGAVAGGVAGADEPAIDDAWRRVQLIAATLQSDELRTLPDAEILRRLYNEDDVRMYDPSPVFFKCRCSRDRVGGVLQGLGEGECRSILAERGTVEVRCDFCNRAYRFDAVDVARLFNPGGGGAAGGRIH